ncbi:MAG: RNA-binding S4 domain-containing protein [Anaerolineae bacterium]|jgi:ribosome-associated protein
MPSEPIRLDQCLKLLNLVQSGGEAKHLIQGGQVLLNGVVETHRSKKIAPGDVIGFRGHDYVVSQDLLRPADQGD